MKKVAAIVALTVGVAACAQPAPEPEPEMPPSTAIRDSIQVSQGMIQGYVTATAEQVSEDLYGYQPTSEVRTLGQILGHIADANRTMCSAVLGEDASAAESVEQMPAKADIQQGLADAFAVCDRAFASVDDESGAEPVNLFGMDLTRLGALSFAVSHQFEHYGNLVTYMRLNDIVPPSSQPMTDDGGM